MATDPSEYDKAVPHIKAHLARVGRAMSRTWTAHAGQPYGQVRPALVEALENEGAERMVPELVDLFAKQISEGIEPPILTSARDVNDGGQR
ncbi:hypothetical protein [Streptomyces sp. NPDC059881]|uniref:hypothetical protein n=1 Tax=Streptomyces sp. NPDC059881 TaxID=3346986 RepID=UPI0036689467